MKLDKLKEELNSLRTFLTVSIALIIAITAGIISRNDKLNNIDSLMILGSIVDIFLFIFIFSILIKISKKTKEIGEI